MSDLASEEAQRVGYIETGREELAGIVHGIGFSYIDTP
jgi:hypothetical protein